MRLQEDNDVGMRKTTLLKLNGVQVGIGSTQHSFRDVLYKGLELSSEGAHHQVRTVMRTLAMKECRLDLRPSRIGSHCDEKIPPSILAIDG